MAIRKFEALRSSACCKLYVNLPIGAVPVVVCRTVGECVIVGSGFDSLGERVGESIGVVVSVAAGVAGHIFHCQVTQVLALVEFLQVPSECRCAARVSSSRV